MEFKTELTSNSNIIKFIASRPLIKGSLQITNIKETKNIPIAQSLFTFPFVKSIFITANFIAIEKKEEFSALEWDSINEELIEVIEENLLQYPSLIVNPENSDKPIDIYVEQTPNQNVLKFIYSQLIVNGSIEIKNSEEAIQFPFAEYLFSFPYVKEIFISNNFISITKNEDYEWTSSLIQEIRKNLYQFLTDKKNINFGIKESSLNLNTENRESRKYSEIENKIRNILEEYVLPAVSSDGGNIELINYDKATKTAYMLLQGACSGCPSSTMTLKNGIQELLRQLMNEKVDFVEAVNG